MDCPACGGGSTRVEGQRDDVAATLELGSDGEVTSGTRVVSITRWQACADCGARWAETVPVADG